MVTDTTSAYWRSHEGGAAYDRVLEAHFEKVFGSCKAVQKLKRVGEIEIFVVHEFPSAGAKTVVTKGMSRFILDSNERVEYAITLRDKYSTDWAVDVVVTLAAAVLQNREPLREHSIVGNVDFGSIGAAVRVQHLIVMLGHWFEQREFHIDNYYPGHILELVPILDSEAKLAASDMEEFYRRGSWGLVDTLDLNRPESASIQ